MYTPGLITDDAPAEPFPSAPVQLAADPWARSPHVPPVPPAAPATRGSGRAAGALGLAGVVLFTGAYIGWNTWRASDTSEDLAQSITDSVLGTDAGLPPAAGADPATTDVFALAVGDCLSSLPVGGGPVSEAPTVPCAEPHSYEVYFTYDLPDTPFPGQTAVTAIADAQCLTSFTTFAGIDYPSSVLVYSYLYPTEQSWAAGDREVVCMVNDPTTPTTTGSLAGVAR